MDALIDAVVKSYGAVALFILAPYFGLFYIWKDNVRLNKAVVSATKAESLAKDGVTEAQRQRVTDAQQVAEKLMELVSEQSGLNRETNIALDQVREMLMHLSTSRVMTNTVRPGTSIG